MPAGDGSRPDMDRDQIWIDDRRLTSGDGSRVMDDNQSPFLYEATKWQSSGELQTYGYPVAWLHRVQYGELFRESKLHRYMSELQSPI